MTDHSSPTAIIQLIERRIGLSIPHQQRVNVEQVLRDMAPEYDLPLIALLRQRPDDSPEWQRIIRALTIGETYFLRDQPHFQILRQHIIPHVIRQQRAEKQLTIWCAGCASGEEPYSIAVTLRECLPDINSWTLTIIGTDINQQAIETAQAGIYRPWSFRQTPAGFQTRYFTHNPQDDTYKIHDYIREMVTFQQMNMLQQQPVPSADIIFCRNVLLYFSDAQTRHAEHLLHQTTATRGWLFLGQAEVIHSERENWITHLFPGAPIYQKPPLPASAAAGVIHHGDFATPDAAHHDTARAGTPDDNDNDEARLYARAVDALHDEQYTRTEQLLAELLTQQPHHARAHVLLAVAFANRRIYPEAQAHLDTAEAIAPLLADVHYVRAVIFLEQRDIAQAKQALQAALYCQRDHALAAFMLGNIYQQQQNRPAALRHWRNALDAIRTDDASAYLTDTSDMTVRALRHHLAAIIP